MGRLVAVLWLVSLPGVVGGLMAEPFWVGALYGYAAAAIVLFSVVAFCYLLDEF